MTTHHFRQAITTRWFGPTNSKESRVKATADAGSLTVPWQYDLSVYDNHLAAAMKLARKLEWFGDWVGGGLPGDKGYVFTSADENTIHRLGGPT